MPMTEKNAHGRLQDQLSSVYFICKATTFIIPTQSIQN